MNVWIQKIYFMQVVHWANQGKSNASLTYYGCKLYPYQHTVIQLYVVSRIHSSNEYLDLQLLSG